MTCDSVGKTHHRIFVEETEKENTYRESLLMPASKTTPFFACAFFCCVFPFSLQKDDVGKRRER